MAGHASQLYARNVAALLAHLAPGGELALDWDDEITAGACVDPPDSGRHDEPATGGVIQPAEETMSHYASSSSS